MDVPKKVIMNGNTTIIIHSRLAVMTPEEQKQWFKEEWEKGNPILKEINSCILDCY